MNSTAELEARISALEPAYRSAGEARIGRALDRYRIPFLYGPPIIILDRDRYEVWRPAFALTDQHGTVIEYAGTPESAAALKQKEPIYRANGMIPLMVRAEDLTGPTWAERLYAQIERAAEQPRPFRIGYGASDRAGQPYR